MPHSFDLPSHVAALDTWSVYWILKVVKNHVAGYYTSSSKSHQPVDEIRIFYQFHCLRSISTNAESVPWIAGCIFISFLFTPPTLVCYGLLSRTQNPHFKKPNVKRIPFEVSKTLPSAGSYRPGKVVQMQSNFSLAMARQRPHLLGLGSTQLCFVWSQMKPIQNGDAPKIHALPVDYILVPAFEMIKRCFPMNLSRNTAPHHTTHAYSMCWYDIS